MLTACAAGCDGNGLALRTLAEGCLAGAALTPFLGTVVARSRRPLATIRLPIVTTLSWISVTFAAVTAVIVAISGPVGITVNGSSGRPLVGLWANHLTVTLLVLVCGVGAIVQSYSMRYLRSDREASRFFAGASLTMASMAVVVTSATAAGLVAGWLATGIGFVAVVAYRKDLPGVTACVRRMRLTFLLGDGALVLALGIIFLRVGNVDLIQVSALREVPGRLGNLGTPVAFLVVVAALARSAQGPLGSWLPGTVSAPTPVSALLHAGVVNGGGILLIRFATLSSNSTPAMATAFVVAGLTAVGATAVMLHKADVKGSLAFSTMGQMGFMVAECAVGAYEIAVVHLVGHAIYKATLFFGSGSQVPRPGRTPVLSRNSVSSLQRAAVAVVIGGFAVGLLAVVSGMAGRRGGGALLVFVGATAGLGVWSWWATGRPKLIVASIAALLAASASYGLIVNGLGHWLTPALPGAGGGTLNPWLLLVVAAVGLIFAALMRVPVLRPWLFATLVDIGTPSAFFDFGLILRTRSPMRLTVRPLYQALPIRRPASTRSAT